MADKPAEAVRAKPDSSLVAAVRAVADGDADAVVSAGNTGAMLAAGLLHLRRLPGVMRPAIARPDPARARPVASCSTPARTPTRAPSTCSSSRTWAPSSARSCSTSRDPEVRLLSIGEEDEKGNQLTLEAHGLLREDAAARTSAATSRAATCSRARPTSSSPTASPATSP